MRRQAKRVFYGTRVLEGLLDEQRDGKNLRPDTMARLVQIVEIWEKVEDDDDRFIRVMAQRRGLIDQ